MFRLKYLPHKEADEEIVFFLRRHPFILWRVLLVYFFLALVPLAAYFIIKNELGFTLQGELELIFIRLLVISFYLFWWLFLYYFWLDYYLDVWLVTNCRVINIEQKGLFNRVVAEHKLFRIQDVRSEQKGIMPTFLNYGEVHIQTAGAEKVVVFEEVPRPHYVAQEIIKLVENHKIKMAREISLKGGSPSGGEKIDQPERIE
ncbi:hypothetical protein CO134_01015 [Candidatus Kuenenbacteria bacterium CG_4_9_14_3_um_filter_39_14]|uniref:YdbS-like PH domain-containing protein n=6 Tax=Candidatus Kueneniibacteriota TaxID=1752740 RepID=A0A2M7ILS6_9BACT|nr:MAG: hypothetical protein COW86_00425 [Candidatus Kuenenbacteria bacterium CG22_combo_CG10-13_8_21_14_all_39_9]PIR80980.1 MAG: hypothetical protein COU24_01015 [Candidatus Kuenenbacteria bacterium CG10_big_fil_rev_8_21_14_0_10_39_14]PIW95786.1 MAG: hypothetical protein COZ84_01615 [Candidatus Kuenenbacteria bacterium CG_4_8_14_3_um_filter_39_15]PIX92523.1 MAG: hypothetical protein COZ26_01355 [Candidatus Kuenenbacteria bacterium CG_4_10_14_3_um_filter_39_14]PJA92260.1 MAG: hypothetical prote